MDNLIYDVNAKKLVDQDRSFNISRFVQLLKELWNNYLKDEIIEDFGEFIEKSGKFDQLNNLPIVKTFSLLP